jgi:serine/threonine-protein phosphatase 4 regulatory subunit 1
MRVTAIELLNSLAVPLGDDLCRQFIIPEVISLIEDPSFLVRRSIALNFFNICKMSGEYELFEKLMPGFVKLSKDDIFRVRRACAERLYDIARFVDLDIKVGVLVEIFLRLAEDPSIQVKEILFFNAGKFISTLPSRVINKAILSHYLSLLDGPLGDMPLDSELQVACAYSFPGVLYAMEKERWPELRILYHNLVNSANVKIRKTLAASLHEVGRILGPVTTEEELMPVFEELIQVLFPLLLPSAYSLPELNPLPSLAPLCDRTWNQCGWVSSNTSPLSSSCCLSLAVSPMFRSSETSSWLPLHLTGDSDK